MNAATLLTDHDDYAALAVAWAMDTLEPADQAVFEAHREGCEDCALTLAAALAVAIELAYGAPDAAPPRLRERVLAATAPRSDGRRPPQGGATGPVAGATPEARRAPAASGPRVGGGGAGGRDGGHGPGGHRTGAGGRPGRRAERPRRDRRDRRHRGRPRARRRGRHRRAAAQRRPSHRLLPLGVPAGGAPQVVGAFAVTTTGPHSHPARLTRPLDGYPVLAVSEEAAGSTPTAPSGVLGNGTLSG